MLWTKQHMHRTSSCKGPNSSSIHNAIIMPPPHVEDLQIDKTLILWWPKVLEKHTSEAHLSIRLQHSCLSFTNFKIKGSLHTHKKTQRPIKLLLSTSYDCQILFDSHKWISYATDVHTLYLVAETKKKWKKNPIETQFKSLIYNSLFFPMHRENKIIIIQRDKKKLKPIDYSQIFNPDWRSEERRVGKECRSRWSPYH